jgi:hypothetical protein
MQYWFMPRRKDKLQDRHEVKIPKSASLPQMWQAMQLLHVRAAGMQTMAAALEQYSKMLHSDRLFQTRSYQMAER